MKARFLVVSFLVVGGLFFAIPAAQAKTASCPCSPCKCSPCTCGGSKGASKGGGGKHHDKEHGHSGSSAGVGVNVDLGTVGHRQAEPDPFTAGGGQPVAHTQEKQKTKRKEPEPTTFDKIKLTGVEGKGDIPPPNTFNVNNDDSPKPGSDAVGDLKKAHDDYHKTCSDWLTKQPNWNSLVHDWTQSSSTEEGNKKSAKAKKKIDKLMDQFNAGDGKQLVDDWKKAFDNALKSGATVDDNSLIPPPKDDIEKKKYAVIKAQNDLKDAQKIYDDKRKNAANQDDEVKKAYDAISNLGATTANDPKYKAAVADLEKKINDAGAKWAATDEGKAEIKKVHEAEKDLDKAKDAWKPFEKYEEKKAASNP